MAFLALQLDVIRELLTGDLAVANRLEALIYSAIYLKVLSNFCLQLTELFLILYWNSIEPVYDCLFHLLMKNTDKSYATSVDQHRSNSLL